MHVESIHDKQRYRNYEIIFNVLFNVECQKNLIILLKMQSRIKYIANVALQLDESIQCYRLD